MREESALTRAKNIPTMLRNARLRLAAKRLVNAMHIRRASGRKTTQELLWRVADIIGRTELAIGLKVPSTLVVDWMNGHATMPGRKLMLLADILDKIADK
jgi:hypothetical protein